MERHRPAIAYTILCLLALPATPGRASGQGQMSPPPPPSRDTVTVAPGPEYGANGVHRWLLGTDWRRLWQTPLTLPVLHIERFDGGLDPQEEGGNSQSITLHMDARDGREWIFRSVNKFPGEKTGIGGLVAWVIQDEVSSLHPAGQLMVPPLLDSLGILHVSPTLYVMPDDPALGTFRRTFAGMVGALELKPNEGPDDTPGFAGSRKVVGSSTFFEHLRETPVHELDEGELLRARLLDFIIGDTDRGTDQWRWARFPYPDEPGRYLWRPIPRDRDWAFVSGDGFITALVRLAYPKLVKYERHFPDIDALTFSSHLIDRNLLTRLDRSDFEAASKEVRARLTDPLIDATVRRLPPRYPASHRERIASTLKARRDRLDGVTGRFYDWLATDVDVEGTDEADRATITRGEDGSVVVALSARGGPPGAPYYRRVFRPDETDEVRVFLGGGADTAVVRGPSDAIRIRVIGGDGDDVLADSSGAGAVHLYDAHGHNRFVRARDTDVNTRPWTQPIVPEGARFGSVWAPDYGKESGWALAADYGEYAGVVVGAGWEWTEYGFRRLPHQWSLKVVPTLATGPLLSAGAFRFGADVTFDYRPENSLHSLQVDARWSDYDAIRWFGLGNATDRVSRRLSLVPLHRGSVAPSLVFRFGAWRPAPPDDGSESSPEIVGAILTDHRPEGLRAALSVGPLFTYTETVPRPGSPFRLQRPVGSGPLWQLGGQLGLQLARVDRTPVPTRGFRFDASARAFPRLDPRATGASGDASAELDGYIPLPGPPFLALRVGGRQAYGDFPPWQAAMLGGRATLRGFDYDRFAGDAAAYGGAELRVPVAEVSLLVRGTLGVFGLADAGRVWLDGASPGGWHTGFGGGLWFRGAGHAVSAYFASGERNKLYLSYGLPF